MLYSGTEDDPVDNGDIKTGLIEVMCRIATRRLFQILYNTINILLALVLGFLWCLAQLDYLLRLTHFMCSQPISGLPSDPLLLVHHGCKLRFAVNFLTELGIINIFWNRWTNIVLWLSFPSSMDWINIFSLVPDPVACFENLLTRLMIINVYYIEWNSIFEL